MALKIGSPTAERLERILIYGDPKTGKSRLATSLTERFGDILYVAADPGSSGLSSVLEKYRTRCRVLTGGNANPPSVQDNPHKDAFLVACNDWIGKPPVEWVGKPSISTIVWDTMTATASDILSYVATSGQFSDKAHIGLGQPGGVEHQKLPMQGDYMATHNIISRLVDFLFKQPLHLIVVCHATYDEPREGGSVEGGPATAGKATVRSFPGRFDTVIHLTRRASTGQNIGAGASDGARASSVTAWTERHGIWSAGIRSGHAVNPMPKLDLDADPVNFWKAFDSHFSLVGKEAVSGVL
jgi:hypothetical protein